MAVLGMMPFSGAGDAVKKGVITPAEALRYAMSVPGETVTMTGMEKPEILRQNLKRFGRCAVAHICNFITSQAAKF
jgi:aryl-alcohol dehydrogenase-like predicted oxidoreductase